MFYIIIGLIFGVLLNLFPIFKPTGAVEIFPEWYGSVSSIRNIQASPDADLKVRFPVATDNDIYLLSSNGKLLAQRNLNGSLASVSRNGEYFAQYEKVGTQVEFLNISGEKFWRINSMEYPFVSTNGKIILLMNGDSSRIRVFNKNGIPAGAMIIQGITCLNIAFAKSSDFSGIGFLDGSYFFLNEKGDIITKGIAPENSPVKGLAVSNNGKFCVVHYGNEKGDFLRLIDSENKSYSIPLKKIHLTRTAIAVTDDGKVAAIDNDRIIITRKNKIKTEIRITPKIPGIASIDFNRNLFTASFTGNDKKVNFFLFLDDGTILQHKIFNEEHYIESGIYGNVILLRGMTDLFCYSFLNPDIQ